MINISKLPVMQASIHTQVIDTTLCIMDESHADGEYDLAVTVYYNYEPASKPLTSKFGMMIEPGTAECFEIEAIVNRETKEVLPYALCEEEYIVEQILEDIDSMYKNEKDFYDDCY